MIERSRRVVLLIDYDNLQICASRDTPGRDLQLSPVVQLAQRYGTVILARAYAEWNLSTERLAVYKAGIEPAFAPVLRTESDRSGKSLADTVMVAEGMDMLWTLSPEVVVLATSDKDLIPLVRVAKQRGAFVVVLGSDFTAIPLREMADEHVTYRQLITDAAGRFTTEPGRQPAALPEASRRRSRERSGRERGATAAAGATTPATSPVPAAPPRVEREPVASAAAIPPEPVAPVTAGAPAEGDAQSTGRRRRRRGSRRRADRLGTGGEGTFAGDSVADSDSIEEAAEMPAEPLAESPAHVEASRLASIEGAPNVSAADVARASDATHELTSSEVAEAAEEPAAPAPRERRRRTRRTPVTAEPDALAAEPAAPPAEEPAAYSAPAPEPEVVSTNGEQPLATPVRRPRRVASASRGRTRRP